MFYELTPQEHKLAHSTYPKKFNKKPHIPLLVQMGTSPEKCQMLRKTEGVTNVDCAYWGNIGIFGFASLEKIPGGEDKGH